MEITYSKSYSEQIFDHFILYGSDYGSTLVFQEYYNLLLENKNKTEEEIVSIIKNYKKTSKSNITVSFSQIGIEFFKPNKYIFPQFYIEYRHDK